MGCSQSSHVAETRTHHRSSSESKISLRKVPEGAQDAFLQTVKGREALKALKEVRESPEESTFPRAVRRKSHSFDQKTLIAVLTDRKDDSKAQKDGDLATDAQNLRKLSFKRRGSLDAAWIRTGNKPVMRSSGEEDWGEPSALRESYDRSSIERTSTGRSSLDRSSFEDNKRNGEIAELFEKLKVEPELEKRLRRHPLIPRAADNDYMELQTLREERRRKSMNDAAVALRKGLYSFESANLAQGRNFSRRSAEDSHRNLKGAMALAPTPTKADLQVQFVLPKKVQKTRQVSPITALPPGFIDHEFYKESSSPIENGTPEVEIPEPEVKSPEAVQVELPAVSPSETPDKVLPGSDSVTSVGDSWPKSSDSESPLAAGDEKNMPKSLSAKKVLLTAIEKAEQAAMAVVAGNGTAVQGDTGLNSWGSYDLNLSESRDGNEPLEAKKEKRTEEEDLFDPELLDIFENVFHEYSAEDWEEKSSEKPRRQSIEAWQRAVAKTRQRKNSKVSIAEGTEILQV